MAEIEKGAALTGTIAPSQSKTLTNLRKVQWSVLGGTAASWLMDHSEVVQGVVLAVIPPAWYGLAVGAVQLATAGLVVVFGKKAVQARIDARQKVIVGQTNLADRVLGPSCLFGLLLLGVLLVADRALAAPPTVTFAWNYDGTVQLKGFRVFKGPNTGALVQVAELPPTARSWPYSFTDPTPQCFGVAAFDPTGLVSVITIQDDAGAPVCLGKPPAPTSFSYKVT